MVSERPAVDTAAALVRAEAAHHSGDLSRAETIYRSILDREPAHPRALHNLGLIALNTGHVDAAEGLLRRALVLAPEMAEAYSNLGLALDRSGKPKEAREAFERAVALRPDYADAWSNLGVSDRARGDLTAAIDKFRRALAAAPKRTEIAANLGAALVEAGEAAEGAAVLSAALGLAPRSPVIHFNLGKAWFVQGALGRAIEHFRHATTLDPAFADAHHTLGHALLASGSLEEGWREYAWRWRAKRFHVPPRDFPIPGWNGESLGGKRILVWSEQGVGDKLLFAGLLPELAQAAAACAVEVEDRLVPLFRRSFPDIEVVARRDPPNEVLNPAAFVVQTPLGDLPRFLRRDLAAFPPARAYLKSDPELTAALVERYRAPGMARIGIAWASRAAKGVPLAAFAPLLTLPGTRWISLQYGDHGDEIRAVESNFGIKIIEDRTIDPLRDFDASVAQTAALDAVVTIQNATVHVAGGLGLPTFALTPAVPDWRWLGRDTSPWHADVRLYRRGPSGDLVAPLARLAVDFKSWLDHFPR